MQSLEVLRTAKACGVYTKSSLMLGLGESDDEVIDTMLDLKASQAPPGLPRCLVHHDRCLPSCPVQPVVCLTAEVAPHASRQLELIS